jgi:hypothetical protein
VCDEVHGMDDHLEWARNRASPTVSDPHLWDFRIFSLGRFVNSIDNVQSNINFGTSEDSFPLQFWHGGNTWYKQPVVVPEWLSAAFIMLLKPLKKYAWCKQIFHYQFPPSLFCLVSLSSNVWHLNSCKYFLQTNFRNMSTPEYRPSSRRRIISFLLLHHCASLTWDEPYR